MPPPVAVSTKGTQGPQGDQGPPGTGGGPAVVAETIALQFGYSSSSQAVLLTPEYAGGAAVDDAVGPFEDYFPLVVPQVVVGDNQAAVLDGTGHTSGGPAVTVTVYGKDARGNEISCAFTTNGANVYASAAPRAFKLPLTRVTTSADLTRSLGVYTGKGCGTAVPFEVGSLECAVGSPVLREAPSYEHGPSGTVVPSSAYNTAESSLFARYRPA